MTRNRKSLAVFLSLLAVLWIAATPAPAETWSFGVIADSRAASSSYRNTLEAIGKPGKPGAGGEAAVELVLAVGDMDPVAQNYRTFRDFFGDGGPLFVPVRGNHESPKDVAFIMNGILPAGGERVRVAPGKGVTYYIDWKNVRIIAVDQYLKSSPGIKDPELIAWVEEAIRSAPEQTHVFVSFHEPDIPDKPASDPFWSMLFKHSDRVRAVVCGHTHTYARRLVTDASGSLHYVNAGNAGRSNHSDSKQTVVMVAVEAGKVGFRTFQAPDGTKDFNLTDQWEVKAPGGK
jgi:hypothetical protein